MRYIKAFNGEIDIGVKQLILVSSLVSYSQISKQGHIIKLQQYYLLILADEQDGARFYEILQKYPVLCEGMNTFFRFDFYFDFFTDRI